MGDRPLLNEIDEPRKTVSCGAVRHTQGLPMGCAQIAVRSILVSENPSEAGKCHWVPQRDPPGRELDDALNWAPEAWRACRAG
jgi:hypothetical protein